MKKEMLAKRESRYVLQERFNCIENVYFENYTQKNSKNLTLNNNISKWTAMMEKHHKEK
jgi:hypothetical protein